MLSKILAIQLSINTEKMIDPTAAKKEFKALEIQFNSKDEFKFETCWKFYTRKNVLPPTFKKAFCDFYLIFIRKRDVKYSAKKTELGSYYKKYDFLKDSIGNTDPENAKHDNARVVFIIQVLNFIKKHHTSPENIFDKLPDMPEVKESLESIWLYELKSNLRMVSRVIGSLSEQFRSQHKDKLTFETRDKWQVLEYFGGFMSEHAGVDSDRDPMLQDNEILLYKNDNKLIPLLQEWFMQLVIQEVKIVEAALADIVKEDVPELVKLFSYIHKPRTEPLEKIQLTNIQILTTHLRDDRSLIELLKFSAQSKPTLRTLIVATDTYAGLDGFLNCALNMLDIDEELGQYAILRRFQILGELMTVKNISRHVRGYLEMVDLKRYVDLRDGLSHQDEHGNKAIVDQLFLTYKPQMKRLLQEVSFLMDATTWVVAKRFSELPSWKKDDLEYIQFWRDLKIYYLSKQEDPTRPFIPNNPLLSPENIQVVLQTIKTYGSEEQHGELEACLQGKAPWLKKASSDTIKRCFFKASPARKDCILFLKKAEAAYDQFRSDAIKDKEKRVLAEKLNRAKKKLDQEAIYEVSQLFNQGVTKLSLEERILWIQEILSTIERILCSTFSKESAAKVTTLKALRESEDFKNKVEILVSQNRILKDALEYQIGLLLQLLDYIVSHYTEKCVGLDCLGNGSESLRSLRNYVEHGNSLLDTIRTNKSYQISQKDQTTSAAVILLLLQLPKELASLLRK